MSWYDKSRAMDEEECEQMPKEMYVIYEDGDPLGLLFDLDEAKREVRERGGMAEFATYVRTSEGNKGSNSAYVNDFPKSLYVVVNWETEDVEGSYTTYDRANTEAVDEGDEARFVKYVRHDRVTFRPARDDEDIPENQMGWVNIHGDRYDEAVRMGPEAYEQYADEQEADA